MIIQSPRLEVPPCTSPCEGTFPTDPVVEVRAERVARRRYSNPDSSVSTSYVNYALALKSCADRLRRADAETARVIRGTFVSTVFMLFNNVSHEEIEADLRNVVKPQ